MSRRLRRKNFPQIACLREALRQAGADLRRGVQCEINSPAMESHLDWQKKAGPPRPGLPTTQPQLTKRKSDTVTEAGSCEWN